jgi:hypothetical protein
MAEQLVRRNRRNLDARDLIQGARLAHTLYRNMPSMSSFMPRGGGGHPTAAQIVRASHELKNFPLSVTGNSLSTSTYVPVLLNAVQQGSSANNRTGRKIQMEKLRLALDFEVDPNNSYDYVRVVLFLDRESRGGAPGAGDLLTNTTSLEHQVLSSLNEDNKNRFKILFDDNITIRQNTINSSSGYLFGGVQRVNVTIPLKAKVDFYNTTTGTIADIDQGALYMFFFGFAANHPTGFSYDTQLFFRDV